MLEGTNPHLIRAEDAVSKDGEGPTVLKDLGIIRGNMVNNAPNWDTTRSLISGGSMFDMLIRLRDALYRGDQDFIGSQGIGGMDLAISNLTTRMADIGSRQERAEFVWQRLNKEIPDVTANIVRESSVDMTDAATTLKFLEFANKASVQTAARLLPVSLLDFLR